MKTKHALVLAALGALLTVASVGGAAIKPYPGSVSWADARHGWAPNYGEWRCKLGKADGSGRVCATEDGGRTWRTIFVGGNYVFWAVRTSATAGIVSTGAHGHVQFWTRDNGRHWFGTEVAGGRGGFNAHIPAFIGRGSQLYWARPFDGRIYQVTPWPPTGEASCAGEWAHSAFSEEDVDPAGNHCQGLPVEAGMQSTEVISGHGSLARWALVPDGVLFLFERPDGSLTAVVRRGGANTVQPLPPASVPDQAAGGVWRLRVAWPAVTVLGRYYAGGLDVEDSWEVIWRSSDGGATWTVDVDVAWRSGSMNPIARAGTAAGVVGDEILLAGGRFSDFSPGLGSSGPVSRTVQAYRPADDTWRSLPHLPAAVGYASGASRGSDLYVVGGFDRKGKPQRTAFVLRNGRWLRLPPAPEPRAAAGAAIVGDKLYVVGGVGGSGLARRALVLDLRTTRWSTASGPRPRKYVAVTAAGGRLVALGGRIAGGAGSSLALAESWRPGERRWQRLPQLPSRRSDGAAVALADGSVVVLGGAATEYYEPVASTLVLAPGGRRWERLPELRTARYGLAAAVFGSRLYALVGGDGDGPGDRGTLTESLPLAP